MTETRATVERWRMTADMTVKRGADGDSWTTEGTATWVRLPDLGEEEPSDES